MGKWATLLKYGKAAVNNTAVRTTGKTMGDAMIHPQRTLAGLGSATKTAVIGGGMGYLAWENIVNDKPIARTAADVLVGEKTVDKGLEIAGQTTDKVGGMVEKMGEGMEGMTSSMSGLSGTWSGIGNFLKNIFGGGGADMFGSFLGNIAKGNVSGLSMLGLVASSLLIFGRFGWLGKIAGALMGMMLIGNNSQKKDIAEREMAEPEKQKSSERSEEQQSGGMKR